MIEVILAEHRQLVRDAMRLLLEQTSDIRVVAEASDSREALSKIAAARPHVSLLATPMPGMDDAELLAAILSIDAGARILVITMDSDPVRIATALQVGAVRCITKCATPSDLYAAIRSLAHGKRHLPEAYRSTVPEELNASETLSSREKQILSLVICGQSQKDIAQELGIGSKTVSTYLSRAAHKLGLDSTRELRLLASRDSRLITRPYQIGGGPSLQNGPGRSCSMSSQIRSLLLPPAFRRIVSIPC